MSKHTDPLTTRQQRHLSYISEFTTDLQHISGKDNVVADCLSRTSVSAPLINDVSLGVDILNMAKEQKNCADIQRLRTCDTGLQLKAIPITEQGPTILCDVSTGQPRPLVALPNRRTVFDTLHGLSHPGTRATKRLITAKYVWPGMNKDITTWTSHCQACQVAKVGRHTHAPLEEFIVPAKRFSHLHVDIVGPLPPSHGFTHLITIVDRTTRWPEAIPLKETTAVDCARAFASSWISRFGIPTDMTSDRGSQFTSNL